ncbi:hypothetical protein [Thalassobellus suaedae]|uniref:DNA replication protein DnaC n=1 Tax=Thalassobellus suaedae TaxID=3074124 RepID=A0ABY9XW82_9FLAO|nr:hypothetical protein RHP51_04755 [Flavobacteriaceae bacterium HL-DH14]
MNQIGKLIGKRKYEALKALDLENITDETLLAFNLQFKNITVGEALKMIKDYEEKYTYLSGDVAKKVGEYFEKINKPQSEKKSKELDKELLWELFTKNYFINEGVRYSKELQSIENIKPLIYYFIGDLENFKNCNNVSELSEPSLNKGLLIIGGYGNGKTSVMKAFESSFKKSNIVFRSYTTNDLVMMYEAIDNQFDKDLYNNNLRSGTIYFDDVLSERDASNFGKVNIMKEIFEERYNRSLRTYITCNYKDDTNDDLEVGLAQFGERYGSRVYDRLFSMFNIIEFKGKSFRK